MPEERVITKEAKIEYNSPFRRSPVDIIIPFYGLYEKVTKLVTSILMATRSNPYQICLVDDCSPNKDFISQFGKVPQVVTVRSDKRLGFGGALELGYKNTQQPWVMFLHSDCVVEDPNWLIELGRTLVKLKDDGVRMASSRTNNPGQDNEKLKSNKGESREDLILEKGDTLPLYCAMAHRDLFTHIGGFVKNYFPIGYEDQELSYRMQFHGFKCAVSGKSWIRHEGGATTQLLCQKSNMRDKIEANMDICLADMRKLYAKK